MSKDRHDFRKQEELDKALYKLGVYFNNNPDISKPFYSYYPENPKKAYQKLMDLFNKWNTDNKIKNAAIYDHQKQNEKGWDILIETLK